VKDLSEHPKRSFIAEPALSEAEGLRMTTWAKNYSGFK
jgi:hypothetical protein